MSCFDNVLDKFVKELLGIIIFIIVIIKKLEEKYLDENVKLIKELKLKFENLV